MLDRDGEDRVSKLPDDILCKILWYLSSEEAIATCFLSKRWRFVWQMVPALDFDLKKAGRNPDRVNKFLSLRRTQKITRFRLICEKDFNILDYMDKRRWCRATTAKKNRELSSLISKYMEKWCYAATAEGKVEHVNLSIGNIIWIERIFTCSTIVSLKLKLYIGDLCELPSSVNLPSLKIFHLHEDNLTSLSGDLPRTRCKNFFYGSPALELFHHSQVIPSLGLRRTPFFIEVKIARNSQHILLFEREILFGHDIFTRVIQSDSHYNFIPDYFENRLENLVKAKVYITESASRTHLSRVFYILQQIPNVEYLSLALFTKNIRAKDDLHLLSFQNLLQLRVYLEDPDSVYKTLAVQCPKLQHSEFSIMDDGYDIHKTCPYHDLSFVPL